VDNLLTGRREDLDQLSREPRFELQQRDICAPFDFGQVDVIFHFASPASPADYMAHGIATLKAGSLGTFNVLELSRKYRSRVLLASASEVYGDPHQTPQQEEYWGYANPVGPRSVYTEAKRLAEVAVAAYHRYHQVDGRVARIFYVYGPRMRIDDGRLISNFMTQALSGQDLTVYGDGMQTRSLTYVSDIIEGVLQLSRSEVRDPVNLGNPEEITVLECARRVLVVTGSGSRLRYEPLPEDDPRQRCPDITRARRLLGWEPKIGLTAGLQLSLEHFRKAIADRARADQPHAS